MTSRFLLIIPVVVLALLVGVLVVLLDDLVEPDPPPAEVTQTQVMLARLLDAPEPGPFVPPPEPVLDEDLGPAVVIEGSGWGHSVGMSQYGAQAQALAGHTYDEILGYYYQGVALEGHPLAVAPIRVDLFLRRSDLDRSRLLLETASHDRRAPDSEVEVELGGDVVSVPFDRTWNLEADQSSGELVLRDADGTEHARGHGPAIVHYDGGGDSPMLLRLPQLQPEGSSNRLAGTYRYGHLEVHHAGGGRLRPVMEMSVEEYLGGLAEVPAGWELEALKAQAVAGRTFAIRHVERGLDPACGCHIGSTPHDQVYAGWGYEGTRNGPRWRTAVDATAGEVATFDGDLAWTYYSSSHGGHSEASEDSWAYNEALPYLRAVDDPWSLDPTVENPYASWVREIGNAEFAAALGSGLTEVRGVRVLERTDGGTPRVLEVRGVDAAGQVVTHPFSGVRTPVAGSDLKLHFRSLLPSQQLTRVGLAPFRDDDGHPAEHAIALAHRQGWVTGCDEPADRFCPDDSLTRGDLAATAARAAELPLTPAGAQEAVFADVPGPENRPEIEAAAAAELMEPCAADRFCPDQAVTAGELVALLERLAAHPATPEGQVPDSDRPADPAATRAELARELVATFDLRW